jgi:hypothetical protein
VVLIRDFFIKGELNLSEEIILTNLIQNDQYTRKVLPFLKRSYFQD